MDVLTRHRSAIADLASLGLGVNGTTTANTGQELLTSTLDVCVCVRYHPAGVLLLAIIRNSAWHSVTL